MRTGRVLVVAGIGLATVLTAAPATAAPGSDLPRAGDPASTVRAGSPAALPAPAPARILPGTQAPGVLRHRDPGYPPTTGRLYLSASRVRVGATVAAVGTGFRPRTPVLVIVRANRSDDGESTSTLVASRVDSRRSRSGRRCATGRACVVRANSAGLALFTVRLTRVGSTTVTAIGLTPQRTIQTLSASVQVVPRRRRSDSDSSSSTGRDPAPATPMTAAGLLLTGVAGLALRRRQRDLSGR